MHAHLMQTAPRADFRLSALIRRLHRWVSLVFMLVVVVIFAMLGLGQQPAQWIYYLPLAPLFLLMISGVYLFFQPLRRLSASQNRSIYMDTTKVLGLPQKWVGRVGIALTAFAVLFMIMDAGMKLAGLPIVLQTSDDLGYPATMGFARGLGVLLLACTALYVFPRTSILGAILFTGYLGGAVATHVRVGSPFFSHVLFGVYLGILLWGGLYLRHPALRAIFPWRR